MRKHDKTLRKSVGGEKQGDCISEKRVITVLISVVYSLFFN